MANNVTTTEERRAMGLARFNHVCEVCGGRYDQTPDGRMCGTGCLMPRIPTANGPYSKREYSKSSRALASAKDSNR